MMRVYRSINQMAAVEVCIDHIGEITEMVRGVHMTEEAKKLIEENMNLARFVAHRFKNTGMEYEDVEAIALYGLSKAAMSYNSGQAKFSTYAVPVIRNEILICLRKKRIFTVSFEEKIGERTVEETLGEHCRGIECAEDVLFLRQALPCLNERERAVIYEIFWNETDQRDIAKKMGCSQPQVSKLRKRAIQKLRAEMAG